MEKNQEQLQEVARGEKEFHGEASCPNCGSGKTVQTGSYVSSRDQCMVYEFRSRDCGQTFEISN